jgi:hypothetical protein
MDSMGDKTSSSDHFTHVEGLREKMILNCNNNNKLNITQNTSSTKKKKEIITSHQSSNYTTNKSNIGMSRLQQGRQHNLPLCFSSKSTLMELEGEINENSKNSPPKDSGLNPFL